MDIQLPPLREIPPSRFDNLGPLPSLVIRNDKDVEVWATTTSYHEYDLFLRRLNESVVGVFLPHTQEKISAVRHMDFSFRNLNMVLSSLFPLF